MITQKPISARLDYDRLQDIEQEKFITGLSTNRIINEGVMVYCRIMDARRRYKMYGREREWNELIKYLNLPYCMSTG